MDIDPFDEGVIAAANGGALNDNHYEPGSDAHDRWEAGFLQQSRDGEEAPHADA